MNYIQNQIKVHIRSMIKTRRKGQSYLYAMFNILNSRKVIYRGKHKRVYKELNRIVSKKIKHLYHDTLIRNISN